MARGGCQPAVDQTNCADRFDRVKMQKSLKVACPFPCALSQVVGDIAVSVKDDLAALERQEAAKKAQRSADAAFLESLREVVPPLGPGSRFEEAAEQKGDDPRCGGRLLAVVTHASVIDGWMGSCSRGGWQREGANCLAFVCRDRASSTSRRHIVAAMLCSAPAARCIPKYVNSALYGLVLLRRWKALEAGRRVQLFGVYIEAVRRAIEQSRVNLKVRLIAAVHCYLYPACSIARGACMVRSIVIE